MLIAACMVGWPAGTLIVAARAVWGTRPRMISAVRDKSPLLSMVRIVFLSLWACQRDGLRRQAQASIRGVQSTRKDTAGKSRRFPTERARCPRYNRKDTA